MKTPFIFIKRTRYNNLVENFKELKERSENAAQFIHEIEKGNLESELDTKTGEADELTQSLVSLQKQMIQVSMEEKQRRWVAEHRSQFIDILRNRNNDLEQLGDDIIRHLVKYLEANQGALYVLNRDENNDEGGTIDMLACYAYGRKKHTSQRIEYGAGLVGQAILERDTIFLSEIPENYTRITSGLGEATPRYLLIVPLKIDDKVYGAVEIASFKELAPYQIEFAEQLGESIASTIANTKNNEQTQRLLKETQQQAEEMRSQEEEMRQNMEELQATQEEMHRKASEIQSRLQAIEESGIASIEFDLKGTILTANANFLKLMGYSLDELRGKHHSMFVTSEYSRSEAYRQFWESLNNGVAQVGEYKRYAKGNKPVYIQGSYSILFDDLGKPEKVLKLAADITSSKLAEEKMVRAASEVKSRLQAIDESGIASIEFDLKGNILSANPNFLKLMGYDEDEVVGRHHRIFVPDEYAGTEEYKLFWESLGMGEAQMGEYRRYAKGNKPVYIQGSYSILRNEEGKPEKILKLAADITSAKLAEEKARESASEVKSRLQAIDESGIASIEFDLKGNILSANTNFLKLMGYREDEVIGRHHRMFVTSEYAATSEYKTFWLNLARGEAQTGTYGRQAKNNREIFIQGSYSVIRNKNGEPERILKLATDVTSIKESRESVDA